MRPVHEWTDLFLLCRDDRINCVDPEGGVEDQPSQRLRPEGLPFSVLGSS